MMRLTIYSNPVSFVQDVETDREFDESGGLDYNVVILDIGKDFGVMYGAGRYLVMSVSDLPDSRTIKLLRHKKLRFVLTYFGSTIHLIDPIEKRYLGRTSFKGCPFYTGYEEMSVGLGVAYGLVPDIYKCQIVDLLHVKNDKITVPRFGRHPKLVISNKMVPEVRKDPEVRIMWNGDCPSET